MLSQGVSAILTAVADRVKWPGSDSSPGMHVSPCPRAPGAQGKWLHGVSSLTLRSPVKCPLLENWNTALLLETKMKSATTKTLRGPKQQPPFADEETESYNG